MVSPQRDSIAPAVPDVQPTKLRPARRPEDPVDVIVERLQQHGDISVTEAELHALVDEQFKLLDRGAKIHDFVPLLTERRVRDLLSNPTQHEPSMVKTLRELRAS